nr:hypothetical protein [uncultured Rhodopila sp.]
MSQHAAPRNSVLVGIWRIARGRADGVGCFGATPRAFLFSLAPLLAFPTVGAVLAVFSDGPRRALTGLGMTLCALLLPPVLSFELARFWNRPDAWLRFATAFNWCQWILLALACLGMVAMSLAIDAGVDESSANQAMLIGLGCYGIWMQWFLASKALSLPAARAMLFVILVNVGTFLVVAVPMALAPGS